MLVSGLRGNTPERHQQFPVQDKPADQMAAYLPTNRTPGNRDCCAPGSSPKTSDHLQRRRSHLHVTAVSSDRQSEQVRPRHAAIHFPPRDQDQASSLKSKHRCLRSEERNQSRSAPDGPVQTQCHDHQNDGRPYAIDAGCSQEPEHAPRQSEYGLEHRAERQEHAADKLQSNTNLHARGNKRA